MSRGNYHNENGAFSLSYKISFAPRYLFIKWNPTTNTGETIRKLFYTITMCVWICAIGWWAAPLAILYEQILTTLNK